VAELLASRAYFDRILAPEEGRPWVAAPLLAESDRVLGWLVEP